MLRVASSAMLLAAMALPALSPQVISAQVPQAAQSIPYPVIRTPDIQVDKGESLFVHFSVKRDTVISVIDRTKVVSRSCGYSMFFIRVFRRTSTSRDSLLLFSDSVRVQSQLTVSPSAIGSDTTRTDSVACRA